MGAPIRLAALDDYGAFSSDSEGLGMVAAAEAISALHWGTGGILRRSRASFFYYLTLDCGLFDPGRAVEKENGLWVVR